MPFNNRQDYVIIDLIQQAARNTKANPLNLGGFSGEGGGVGIPPGGFIGQLIQTQVAYDATEAATLATSISGSLLDNLNHIRYRIQSLEATSGIIVIDDDTPATFDPTTTIHFSGAGVTVVDLPGNVVRVEIPGGAANPLTVEELDGSPSVTNVDKIVISGGTVTDLGSGDVLIAFSGGGGSGTIVVEEIGGTPTVSPTDKITFSGLEVEDSGSGDALVYIKSQRQGVATRRTYYPVADGQFLDTSVSYYGLYFEPHPTATSVSSGALTATTEFGQSITPPGEPGAYAIGEGVYVFHIRARRLSGTKNVKVLGRVYTRTSGGSETLIAESNQTANLTGSYANYTMVAKTDAGTIIAPTDRIVIKYAATPYDAGTDPTAQIDFNNSSGYTRVELATSIQDEHFLRTGGWIGRPETWTRTGNHTFTMAGDWTDIYRKAVRVRYRDGGSNEYGTILSSSHAAGTTTITLITNTSHTMAAATITHRYISYMERPEGFPNSFTWDSAPANVTIGSGTVTTGFFPGIDGHIDWEWLFELGSGSAISGSVDITPPANSIDFGFRQPVGVATYVDSGASSYAGVVLSVSGNSFRTRAFGTAGTYVTQAVLSSTVPFTWVSGDSISLIGRYPY